jgi:uncharacterized protein YndB with AHSA1/START domain
VAQIDRTRTIAAAPQEVWEVLADFGALSTWVERADHSPSKSALAEYNIWPNASCAD